LAFGLGISSGDNDIWIYDLDKKASNRLTFTKSVGSPLWSLDGKNLYYSVSVPQGIMMQPANGGSPGAVVLRSKLPVFPSSLTRNGKQLIVSEFGASEILIADLEKGTGMTPLITGASFSWGGEISPDGRFIMYGSNVGGLEIFVSSFPDLKGKWQISVGGGLTSIWSPDGSEIFYVNTVGKMMAVAVKTTPAFSPGQPRELFDVSQMWFPNDPVRNFDISPDGKRFILVQNTRNSTRMSSFNYVQDWGKELERQFR